MICRICKCDLNSTSFNKRRTECKSCQKDIKKKWQQANKLKVKITPAKKQCADCKVIKPTNHFSKDYDTKDGLQYICKFCSKERFVRYRCSLEYKYSEYKSNAKRRNLDFRLTLEDFKEITLRPCRYCGVLPIPVGLDRIDNTRGYILDNVISCCGMCNHMKSNYLISDFLNQIEKIYKNNFKK